MPWKEFPSKPWVAWVGLISLFWGIPGMFDDGSVWGRLAIISPTLSTFVAGSGFSLLCLFLVLKIDQIRQDENARLHRWIEGLKERFFSTSWRERWWYFREVSFTWLFIKIVLFAGFVAPPLIYFAVVVIFGGFAFWIWILSGEEMTYMETFRDLTERQQSRRSD